MTTPFSFLFGANIWNVAIIVCNNVSYECSFLYHMNVLQKERHLYNIYMRIFYKTCGYIS